MLIVVAIVCVSLNLEKPKDLLDLFDEKTYNAVGI